MLDFCSKLSQKRKRILPFILVLALLASFMPMNNITVSAVDTPSGFWTDPGIISENAPDLSGSTYTIDCAEELAWVADKVNSGTTFAGYTIKLADSITELDLSAHYWSPIGVGNGDASKYFAGIFDGNSKIISNMTIVKTGDPSIYYELGLFGYADGAIIKNIELKNASVTNDSISNLGCLAGKIRNTSIINVNVTGRINTGHSGEAGGIVGNAMLNILFVDCSASIEISCSENNVTGGIVGEIQYGAIVRCSSSGNISGSWSGGIAGNSCSMVIADSYSSANISGINPSGINTMVGGLIGISSYGTIINCYCTGSVSGIASDTYMGGLIGSSFGDIITNAFWNYEAAQNVNGQPRKTKIGIGNNVSSMSIKHKTSSEMKSTDFVSLLNSYSRANWSIDTNINNGYPYINMSEYNSDPYYLKDVDEAAADFLQLDYCDVTKNMLLSAKSAAEVILGNPSSTQMEIDKATYDLYAAIQRAYLEDLVTIANAENEADYTAERWAVLQTETATADSLLSDAASFASDITTSIDHLNFVLHTLKNFDNVISTAGLYSFEDSTPRSWSIFQTALAEANALQADPYWKYDEIAASAENLLKAMYLIDVDSGIQWASYLLNSEYKDQTFYSSSTIDKLNIALVLAEAVMANPDSKTLDEVNNTSDQIEFACYLADNEYMISYTKYLKSSDYTSEEWNNFQSAIANTQAVDNNPSATLDDVREVNYALRDAYAMVFVYSDVEPTNFYYSDILKITKLGAMEGFEDGTFRPKQVLDKEVAVMIAKHLGKDITAANYDPSTDPDVLAYFPNHQYGITRETTIYALLKLLGADTSGYDTNGILSAFSDKDSITPACRDAMAYVVNKRIILGTTGGNLQPQSEMHRWELALIYLRILNRSADQPAPAGLKGVAPTSETSNDGKITGTTVDMEFKLSAENIWTRAAGISITGLVPGTYNVRYAEKSGFSAGKIAIVVVPAYVPPTGTGDGGTYTGGSTAGTDTSAGTGDTKVTEIANGIKTTVKIQGEEDAAKGLITATVKAEVIDSLIKDASSAETAGKHAIMEIAVETANQANDSQINIPRDSFDKMAIGTNAGLIVNAGNGILTFSSAAVESISNAAAGDISISISKVDLSSLSATLKSKVGNRPVYSLSVKAGSTEISSFGAGKVTVSLPYTLKAGEDPNAVIIYYIDNSGNLQFVRCIYNAAAKTVQFTVNHFSMYMIGYNKLYFNDVRDSDWFGSAVSFIAARGITTGTSADSFSPNATLTRGQFIVMLMKAYGIVPEADVSDNFADAGKTYYTSYLATAKKLGITQGFGNNLYKPEDRITRQDMFTLLYRALGKIGQIPAGTNSRNLTSFSDGANVSTYARDAVNAFIKSGIITGSDGKLNPRDNCTRAQMAKVIYSLLAIE